MARIAVGTGLYGRCDQVENLGHVAHYFFHIGHSPLIPLRSVFVLDADEAEIKLPFSWKAMFFGYLRAFLLWCMGLSALLACFALAGRGTQLDTASGPILLDSGFGYAALGVVAALSIALGLSYVVARPSLTRREQLLNRLRQAGLGV